MMAFRVICMFVISMLALATCTEVGKNTTFPPAPDKPTPSQQPPPPGQGPAKLPPL